MDDQERAFDRVRDAIECHARGDFEYFVHAVDAEHPLRMLSPARDGQCGALPARAGERHRAVIPLAAPADARRQTLFERRRPSRIVAAEAHADNADAVGIDIATRLQIIDARDRGAFGLGKRVKSRRRSASPTPG